MAKTLEKKPGAKRSAVPRRGGLFFHPAWRIIWLTLMGLGVGLLHLALGATAYPKLPCMKVFLSYFVNPKLLLLNLFPGVLLIWLFYFLFRRPWAAFLGAYLPVVGVSLVNYFKIRLRSDPLLAVDLRLVSEAGGVTGSYTLDFTWLVWFAILCLIGGLLFAKFFLPNGRKGWKRRLIGTLVCAALAVASMTGVYMNKQVYDGAQNDMALEHRWVNPMSATEVFASKGCIYPFLYSFRDMFPVPPEGYDEGDALQLLNKYQDQDIPADKKVSVMGIMLEAFSDFTDFPMMADQPAVAKLYEPWHAFEQQSVHGNLTTNIFAGGTVDSEWAFLTGYTQHDEFRSIVDSYVWYFKEQGYQTFGIHPGNDWFYNRVNVNQYLGFDEYWFIENRYADKLTMASAFLNSDNLIARDLLNELGSHVENGPALSFSVSIQNHGPYETGYVVGKEYVTPASTGMSQESCNIFNNYLHGIDNTIGVMTAMRDELEAMREPVVLVLFGDHKPWGGNGNTGYSEMGVDFDLSTTQGFYDYYTTPYLIWANSAAKEVLGNDFVGEGGDCSPAFLMSKLFDLCGWEGPAFMQLSREMREITPTVHVLDRYLKNGQIVAELPPAEADFLRRFKGAQYYREHEVVPKASLETEQTD